MAMMLGKRMTPCPGVRSNKTFIREKAIHQQARFRTRTERRHTACETPGSRTTRLCLPRHGKDVRRRNRAESIWSETRYSRQRARWWQRAFGGSVVPLSSLLPVVVRILFAAVFFLCFWIIEPRGMLARYCVRANMIESAGGLGVKAGLVLGVRIVREAWRGHGGRWKHNTAQRHNTVQKQLSPKYELKFLKDSHL
jgi:hypothetical protein